MEIVRVDKSKYRIPMSGHPTLHEELAWYATDHDAVLGVVIRDRIDHDYSWVVLSETNSDGFRAVDIATSRPNVDVATAELHAAMTKFRVTRKSSFGPPW